MKKQHLELLRRCVCPYNNPEADVFTVGVAGNPYRCPVQIAHQELTRIDHRGPDYAEGWSRVFIQSFWVLLDGFHTGEVRVSFGRE